MRYSNILSKVIKNAKISYYNEQIIHSNNKIKTAWNIVTSKTGGNNITCDKVNFLNTDKENNNSVNAESFNKYFLTVAENISCKITGSNKQIISSHKHSLSYLSQVFSLPFTNTVFHNTSTGEITKIIHSFPCKHSCGYDEILMKILKISSPFISSSLWHIVNASLNSGVFPTRLKYSIITPLHKKGDKNNVSNYRPISLLTSFSKIFEKKYI
jgi:Notch-like protein